MKYMGVNTTNEMGVVILLYLISDRNISLFLFTFSSQGWDGNYFSGNTKLFDNHSGGFTGIVYAGLCGMRDVLT